MQVSTLMTVGPQTVDADSSLDRAMELMDEHGIRHLPVVRGDELLGVISDRDLLEATGWLHPRQLEALEAPLKTVGQLLTGDIDTLTSDSDLGAALDLFVTHRVGSLPVLEDGKLAGILTEMDVLRAYIDGTRRSEIPRDADHPVRDTMTPDPVTIAPSVGGQEVAAQFADLRIHHLPVVESGDLVGIVSDRDIRRAHGRGQLETTLVHEVMSAEPQTVRADAPLSSAALLLTTERISALPVLDDGQLVGLLTTLDAIVPCALALQKAGGD